MDRPENIVTLVGATGVLGRNLVPMLVQAGYAVRILARSPSKAARLFGNSADIHAFDLLDPGVRMQLPGLIEGSRWVAHIATAIPRDSRVPGAWDANTKLRIEGTRILLEAVVQAGVQSYIQQSIAMAYVEGGDRLLDEDTPLDASGDLPYALPVIRMEEMVRTMGGQHLRWSILRGGSFVGPGTSEDETIARLKSGTETIPGDGLNFISNIHVADMASAVVASITRDPQSGTYNIVDMPIRYGEYLTRLSTTLNTPPPQADIRMANYRSFRCTNERAKKELGWEPRHSIGMEIGRS